MSNNDTLKRLYVRANAQSRQALKLVRARLLALPQTEDVTQEEVVAASWVWMKGMDPETLARELSPIIAALREQTHGPEGTPARGGIVGRKAEPPEGKKAPKRKSG